MLVVIGMNVGIIDVGGFEDGKVFKGIMLSRGFFLFFFCILLLKFKFLVIILFVC